MQALLTTEACVGVSGGGMGEGRARRFPPMVQAGEGRLRAEPASQGGENLDTVLSGRRTRLDSQQNACCFLLKP